MGSKGRMPPPHLRQPLPGPDVMHHDPFGPGIRPMPGAFPHFDMLPPPEVMEQKVAAQHVEIQKLVRENQRLAATHGTLRQELAAAQHELQILHAQIGAMKSEREQQMRSLTDKIANMEADLKAAEPVKSELQQARTDAQNLVVAREELITKVHQLTQDLQRAHADVQQIPALMSELDSLRQEYHHCRATYEYEKKFYNDHLESLQVMEKNYITMAREVEKLQAELTNASNVDRRAGGPYSSATGNNENDTSVHPVRQNAYEDGYGVPQRHGPLAPASVSTPAYAGAQSGHPTAMAGYDAPRASGFEPSKGHSYDALRGPNYDAQKGPNYDAQRGLGYDIHRGTGYDVQRGAGYDPQRVAAYDPQRVAGYDAQRGQAYDVQRGPGYDSSRGSRYDGPARGATAPHGQVTLNIAPYSSATPTARSGSGYEAPPRGGNPGRR